MTTGAPTADGGTTPATRVPVDVRPTRATVRGHPPPASTTRASSTTPVASHWWPTSRADRPTRWSPRP